MASYIYEDKLSLLPKMNINLRRIFLRIRSLRLVYLGQNESIKVQKAIDNSVILRIIILCATIAQ